MEKVIIGYTALILNLGCRVPQIIDMFTSDKHHLTIGLFLFFVIQCVYSALYVAYGFIIHDDIYIISSSVSVAQNVIILARYFYLDKIRKSTNQMMHKKIQAVFGGKPVTDTIDEMNKNQHQNPQTPRKPFGWVDFSKDCEDHYVDSNLHLFYNAGELIKVNVVYCERTGRYLYYNDNRYAPITDVLYDLQSYVMRSKFLRTKIGDNFSVPLVFSIERYDGLCVLRCS